MPRTRVDVLAKSSRPSGCRIEGACKACGEERRPGVQVCLVELVDTGLPEVLLVSVTWKRVKRCRCRLCRAEDENGSAWDGYKRRRRSRWIEGKLLEFPRLSGVTGLWYILTRASGPLCPARVWRKYTRATPACPGLGCAMWLF